MFLKRNLIGSLGLVLAFGLVAFAQQPQEQTQTPDGTIRRDRIERKERHRERMGRHKEMRGHGRLMRELNLSDTQREQIRAINQRRLESLRPQREELFRLREKQIAGTFTSEDEARARALRQEVEASMQSVRTETEGILTAEQKAKREQLKQERGAKHEERKARHEQRMKERQELLNKNPQ